METQRAIKTFHADSRDGQEAVKQASTEAMNWIREKEQLDHIRAEYEKSVCRRLKEAKPIQFQTVIFADGSGPPPNCCHENVNRWVKGNPGAIAVRGWVTYADFGVSIGLTAHSVIQDRDGQLFDITPLGNERVRAGMRFVPHIGAEQEFATMKESSIFIECPKE